MNFINKIIEKIKYYKRFDEKYKISLYSTSISFYMFIASFSLINIFLGIISEYLENVDSYVLSNIIEIFDYFQYYEYFSINTSSIFFMLSVIWSSSKVINAFNKVSDHIYEIKNRRNAWLLRFSSFVMFLFLLTILIGELIINIFINKILIILKINVYVFRIIEFIMEILIIYFVIVFLYIYAPPNKMRYSQVKKGALIASTLLYLLIVLVILIYSVMIKYFELLNVNNLLVMIISIYLLSLFVCNYILIFGLIVNSKNFKFLNFLKGK